MDFYIYEHWRPDTNTCFYVGKGTARRAWVMSNRNPHHKAIQSKLTSMGLSIDIKIVVSNLTEEAAFLVERDRIAFYGRDNLSNMTGGGEGISNPSEEVRKKQSDANKNKVFTDEYRRKLSDAASKRKIGPHSPEHRAKIGAAGKGRVFSEEHKRKLSESNKGKKHQSHSEETRAKMSEFQKNRKRKLFSDETKLKMSNSHKGRPWSEKRRLAQKGA